MVCIRWLATIFSAQHAHICDWMRSMKILFDAQIFEMQKHGGISRYYTELITGIPKTGKAEVAFPIAHALNQHLIEANAFPSNKVRHTPNIDAFASGLSFKGKSKLFDIYKYMWEALPQHSNARHVTKYFQHPDKYDIYHPTYYGEFVDLSRVKKPIVVTVYDMIHELFPDMFSKTNLTSKFKKRSVDIAERIIAISYSTKKDLIDIWGVPESKIDVVYLGASASFGSQIPPALVPNFPLGSRYILYVGSRVGYKNFWNFLEGIKNLLISDRSLYLLSVGGYNGNSEFSNEELARLNSMDLRDKVVSVHANDLQLRSYYSHAECFVFPSLYEGFGLPILEAMNCGTPMALSNTSSFAEVAGDAAQYFDPNDPPEIGKRVEEIIYSKEKQVHLREMCRRRTGMFSWESTVDGTIRSYARVLSGRLSDDMPDVR